MTRIEDKILDILKKDLSEEVSYEILGGPTPSSTLKAPIDYARSVQKATVPQANPIPGVGEIGSDQAGNNPSITDGLVAEDEDEFNDHDDDNKKDHDDDDDKDGDKDDLEETFASLLARLAEEDLAEDEESLMADNGGNPEVTLPTVDSKLEDPDSLAVVGDGIKVAEDETSLLSKPSEEPAVTLPDVDSELETPERLATPAPGSKPPNQPFGSDAAVKEDIAAIFAGTKLSEAAKQKATVIFQAAVTRRVNEEKTRVQKVASKKLKEAWSILKSRSDKKQEVFEGNLTGQVDRYLNYVVENWMDDNRLAVERGIRGELAESFINGLKTLFVEHYIEIPESKVDVVETLGKKVTKLEAKLNEAIESNVKMRSSLSTYRKEEVVRAVSSGLAETQREKLKGLAEGVEYTTRKEYAEKVLSLKEAYFPKKTTPVKQDEQPLMEATKQPTSDMAVYTKTLSKMNKTNL